MHSISPQTKRGVYSLITTFMFIMVILFAVIGLVYLGGIVEKKKEGVNDEALKYQYVFEAKDRILSQDCHGSIIKESGANITCGFPPNIIQGYVIEMLPYGNCTNETRTWSHVFTDDGESETYSYFVAIQDDESEMICPGRLKVMY